MNRIASRWLKIALLLLVFTGLADAQKSSNAVLWERVRTADLDLIDGPGGDRMRPDLSKIEFIKEEKGGYNKKYRIKDGSGRIWVAKLGREARPETAAVRLLWALGYKTEINYLVPTITIPGKGTFSNVRLEARPANVKRAGEWKWKSNPFLGMPEFNGLKMMQVFMTNWDVLDLQNKILEVNGERHYVISDLGRTFGRLGNNNFPIFYRLGRRTGSPKHYARTRFVKEVEKGELKLAYKGKNRGLFKGFTVADARWLSNRLSQLSDKQIGDAFRAANFPPGEVAMYTQSVRRKITELRNAAGADNLAGER